MNEEADCEMHLRVRWLLFWEIFHDIFLVVHMTSWGGGKDCVCDVILIFSTWRSDFVFWLQMILLIIVTKCAPSPSSPSSRRLL
jgi:hypothetical protein